MHRVMWVLLLAAAAVSAQNSQAPRRKDSITVTPGAPTQEELLTRQCDAKIDLAYELSKRGEHTQALALLDEAWRMTEKHQALQGRRWLIWRARGQALVRAAKPEGAIEAFQKRLELEREDCANAAEGVPYADSCAVAMMELGSAQLMAGKNADASRNLLQAAAHYRTCTKESPATSELVRVTYRKFVAEATLMAAMAQARLSQKMEAKRLITSSIQELEGVIQHPAANQALKANASQVLKFARQQAESLQ